LCCESFIGYTFKTFIYPGKRERYDGKPLVLPPYGIEDEPWLYSLDETYSIKK
jgi:hypothetical protein